MRDEFNEDVKRTVAERARYLCSRPSCRAFTSGPRRDSSKSLNVGVAAHITAASPGGPRYDAALTPEERRHVDNAIWLCQTCGKLVDNDEGRFTKNDLQQWKATAEAEALAVIGRPAAAHPVIFSASPIPDLVKTYLEEVTAQKPYTFWNNQTYLQRGVTKAPGRRNKTHNDKSNSSEELEEVLAREKRLMLLGEPGIGKTTSLQHLAWKAASHALNILSSSKLKIKIPIYIELKNYQGEAELETLLASQVNKVLRSRNLVLAPSLRESTNILWTLLIQAEYEFLLLVDGLNEVRPEFHTAARNALEVMLNSPHSTVISCRERDYDRSMQHYTEAYELVPLQEDEIISFLRRSAEERGARLFYEYHLRDPKILTLASNPLILWLISMIMRDDPKEVHLLAKRGKLFKQFIEHMPRLRASEGIRTNVPVDVVIAALAKLGFEMQRTGRLATDLRDIRQWEVPTTDRTLEDVLIQAKEWRFLKCDGTMGEPVEFLHPLFGEFFAAIYLDTKLRAGQDFGTLLCELPINSQWNEVIEMLGGISDRSSELVIWLNQRALTKKEWHLAALATRCLKAGNAVYDKEACLSVVNLINVTPKGLNEIEEVRDIPDEIVETLKSMGDPHAVEPLMTVLQNVYGATANKAAVALGQLRNLQVVDPLITILQSDTDDTGKLAGVVEALGELGDLRVVEPLIKLSQKGDHFNGPFSFICEDALWALEKIIDQGAVKRLIQILSCHKENVDSTPLSTLIKSITDVLKLTELQGYFSDTLHLNVLYSLMDIEHPQFIKPLRIFLDEIKERNTGLENFISSNLQRIQELQDRHPLLALLNPDSEVRRQAAIILGEVGDLWVAQYLEKLARDDLGWSLFGTVADAAQEAIEKIQKRQH
jgi:HEAT repeat protein